MTTANIFEVAVRSKMRFPFRGNVSVEDLWDLSVEQLDSVYKALNSELKSTQQEGESLLSTVSQSDKILQTKIEIVKHIFNVKIEERNARLQEKEKAEQRQKILSIMSTKQDQDLQNKSVEELQSMLDELKKG